MIYYTSIEQSEHLVELGLSFKSSDMCYPKKESTFENGYAEKPVCHYSGIGLTIPCWSLGALSNVIYKFVIHEYGLKGLVGMYVCSISEFTTYYANDADVVHEEKGETFLESVYKMVCYLLENGLIKNCKS